MNRATKSLYLPLLRAGCAPLLAIFLAPQAAHAAPSDADRAVQVAVAQLQDLGSRLRPQQRRDSDRLLAALSPTPGATPAVLATPAALPAPAPVAVAEPRFDLSVNSAPAAQVFLCLLYTSDAADE